MRWRGCENWIELKIVVGWDVAVLDTFCKAMVIFVPNTDVNKSTKTKTLFSVSLLTCKLMERDCISRSPSQHALGDRQGNTLSIHTCGKFTVSTWLDLYVFGLWEDIGAPRGDLLKHRQHVNYNRLHSCSCIPIFRALHCTCFYQK